MKKIRLVNTEGTSNKFYIMEQHDSQTWTARYGRIERPESAQSSLYGMYYWDKKLNEKLKKGYRYDSEVAVTFDDVFAALDALEAQMKAQEV